MEVSSCASVSIGFVVQNLSHGKEFDLHESEPVDGTRFHKKGFTQRLVLIRSYKMFG